MRVVAACLLLLACSAFAGPPLPAAVRAEAPGLLVPLGEARLRKMLFHVYDASLWVTDRGWSPEAPFALDIRYAMSVRGADLTRRSVEEMRRAGVATAPQLQRWEQAMAQVFPDIAPGDRLVGVNVPGVGARFHGAKGFIGEIADPQFARAFFAIWLDERTSEPQMRRRLLRLDDSGAP